MWTDRVFVSHTSDMGDFPAKRSFVQASLDAAVRAGMVPVDMRYFAARDSQPTDYCRERVRDCEIYIAVIGFRYGSIVPGDAVSYTELEFNEAGASGRPRLVFLLGDRAGLPGWLVDADSGAVEGFRQRIRDAGLITATFAEPAELELEVFHALTELVRRRLRDAPRELPIAVPGFTGREAELERLDQLDRRHANEMGAEVLIAVITGMPGFRATCERTTAPADVVLPVWAAGAAYLGGTGLKAMASAGLVTEATPGSLAALSTAMSWEPAPWCPMTF
jgi:hypothetical protein